MSTNLLWQLNRTCLDKQSYSLKEADNLVTILLNDSKLAYYYRCNLCSRYHLTSKEPTVYNEAEHYKVI